MRLNRKASLEIGINTIVILVIAMMLLGLGIGFVKSLFGQMNKIPGKIAIPDVGSEPTNADPVVLSNSELSIKTNTVEQVGVGVYNKWTDKTWFTIGITDCTGDVKPLVESLPQQIAKTESSGYLINIYGNKDENGAKGDPLDVGTYICNLVVYGGTEKTNIDETTPLANQQIRLIITG